MKRSVLFRLLSMLLVFAMLVELLPAGAFAAPAEEDDYLPPAQAEAVPDEPAEAEATAEAETLDPTVLGEITELREENVKHFRMDDGSNLAVSFGSQIHYKDKNGEWTDIDNTLTLKSDEPVEDVDSNCATATKSDVYEAVNGDQIRQFAATIEENGFLFSAKSGGNGFSLFIEGREQDEAFDDDNNVEDADPTADDQQNVEEEIFEEELPVEQTETADDASDDENDGEAAPTEGQMDPEVEPAEDQQNDDGETDLIDTPTAEPVSENLDQTNNAPQQYSVPAKISYPSARYAEMSEEEKQALPISEQIEPEKLAANISYNNVWPDTDILYQPYGMNVKESIILTQPKEQYEYSFRLHLDGFSATLNEDGGISLMDADGESVFEIPAPYMEDSDGALSSDVSYSLTEAQEDYILSIWADPDWVNDPNRVWPITIDPTVMYRSNSSNPNILTSYVNSGRPTTASYNNTGYLRSGYYTNTSYDANCTGHTVGLIYVNNLPEVPNGCVVTAAHLEFSQVLYGGVENYGYHKLYATTVSAPGNPTTYLSGMTWNSYINNILPYYINQSEEEPAALDYNKEYISPGKKTTYAITSAAKSWYDPNDSSVSRLLVLDNGHTSTTNARVTYAGYKYGASVYEPKIYVQYLNTVGIDGNSGYHTQDIGRAGTGYVNDFTLKSSLSVPLITAPSDALPFTLSAIYNEDRSNAQFSSNSNNGVHTANYSTSNLGYGWKLSVQQSICSVSVTYGSSDKTYLVYTDSDGTEHYFSKETGETEYKDEEGLGLKITGSASSYSMKDKNGNSWVFSYGYLTEYTSSEGNKLYYAYDGVEYAEESAWRPTNSTNAHRVTSVWRENKDAEVKILASLHYNGNHLSYVEDAAGRKTQFGYSNSSAIVMNSIRFPDDNTVSYAFSLNNSYYRITEAKDNEKGYKINYEYQDGHPLRVLRFKESVKNSAGNWIEGQKVNCYQYGANYSRFRYFDTGDTSNNGKLVTLHYFDNVGRTVNTVTMNAAETEVLGVSAGEYTHNSGTSASNNRLLSAASAGVQTTNLLIDSGLESSNPGSNWSPVGSGSISYVSTYNSQTPHSGNKMMKMTLTNNSLYKAYQSVYLKGGTTYVLSAYVNSLGATTFDTSEAYLEFESNSGASLGVQSNRIKYYTNSNISNGWARLEVSFTPSTSGTYRAEAVLENWIGTILFDDFQLEAVPDIDTDEGGAGTVNLLQYGSMEKQTGSNSYSTAGITNWWTYTTSEAVPSSSKAHTGKYSMTFAPSMSAKRRAKQTIQLNSKANKTFVLSAWGWTPKTNLYDGKEMEGDNSNEARFFGIIAKLEYENNAYDPDYFYLSFNGDISNWQYASTMIVPKQAEEHPNATVSQITLSAALDYCANRAYIDDISLTAEPVQTYKYDNDGNLVSASDSEGKTTVDRDDYDRIEKYTALNNVVYDLHYPSNNTTTQNPDTITCDGVVTTKEYKAGLETKTTVQKNGSNLYTESSATLNGTKDFYASVTDVNGITANYYYNELKGLLTSSVVPSTATDREIHYTYYANNNRPKSTYQEGVANITRYYADNGLLSRIKRKTFRNGNEVYQAYNFSYNDWGQRTKITINNGSDGTATILASYGYDSKGRQTALAYGYDLNDSSSSGDHISYEYDLLDRPVHKVYYSGSDTVEGDYHYVYDAQGNLSRQYAMGSGSSHSEEYQFEYDSLGRLIRSQELTPEGYIKQRTEHVYDTANRISSQAWTVGNNSFSETYSYNDPSNNSATDHDGSLASVQAATGDTLLYGYDDLRRVNRVTTKNTSNAEIFYAVRSFERFSGNTNRTKDRISAFSYRKPNETLIAGNTYSYDTCGNISQIGEMVGNTSRTQATYTYDNQDQLTQEVRYNYIGNSTTPTSTDITNYTYDTAGNLMYSSSTNSDSLITTNISYSYGDNSWRDRLTEINVDGTSKKIAYEGQTYNATNNTVSGTAKSGNPINWYNGVLYTNLTWTQGRRLSSLNKGSASISYTYDLEGIRSSKTTGSYHYDYITQNGKVVREYVTNASTGAFVRCLDFFYDFNGQPFAMRKYRNSTLSDYDTFHYVLNAQGDVVQINFQGDTVYATYTYDAWGNILTSSGSLANINPLRYQGYYYDTETGWYYLKSRYYDPAIKRFLNADSLTGTNSGFIGKNMFVYSNNNPVNASDSSGNRPSWERNCGGKMGYTDTCKMKVYRNGPTTVTVRKQSITLDINVKKIGGANQEEWEKCKQGAKSYLEKSYSINGTTKRVTLNINESNSNYAAVVVRNIGGTSKTWSSFRGYDKTIVSICTSYPKESSTTSKDIGWSFAHELCHCFGIGDYYTHVDAKEPGFDHDDESIMNYATCSASEYDIMMILQAAESGRWTDWEEIP